MSEEQKRSPSEDARGGGAGGGGKSLALMQQCLLSKPHAQAEESAEAAAAAAPAPPTGSAPAHLLASQTAAQNRPKGKDFAAMAMNAGAPKPSGPSPAPTAHIPPNRPKGKDFAAMANRMGAPSPPFPAPQQSPTSAFAEARAYAEAQDPGRAARMQAAARAAAGLPPLEKPTATSISTPQPPITALVTAPDTRALPVPTSRVAPIPGPSVAVSRVAPTPAPRVAPVPAPVPAPPYTTAAYDYNQASAAAIAAEARQQHLLKKETKMTSARPQPQDRRLNSGPSTSAAPPAAAPAPPLAPAKPTPQPGVSESRLSAASILGTGAPHTSPLIGQRLKDLVSSLDPNYALDAQAEEQILQLADDFLDKVTKQSTRLAQHRGSKTMDVQDVQLALSKQWGIVVPGLGAPTLRPSKAGSRVAASSSGTKRRSSESKGGSRAKKTKPNTTAAAASSSAPLSTS